MATYHDQTTAVETQSGPRCLTNNADAAVYTLSAAHTSIPAQLNGPRTEQQRSSSQDTLNDTATSGLNEKRRDSRDSQDDIEKQESKDKKNEDDDEEDPNIVGWDGDDDPGNPQNWKPGKKWLYTFVLGLTTFTVTFASSVFSTAVMPTSKLFGVSPVVMVLGTSLFVLGFAFGPIVFGPLSELFGRRQPLFIGLYIFAIFQIPVAVAQNLQTIFICRFFGGFFASAPLAIIGGILNDMFDPVDRGVAMAVFAGNTFMGPVVGPIVGSFITQSYLGWRWTEWITLIMSIFFSTIAFLIVPETYEQVLLQRKAEKLKYKTKNWALHAKADEQQVTAKDILEKYLLRPFKMLAMEPILVLVTLYMGFIYAFLYLCFEAYPIAFEEERGWGLGVSSLPFIAVMIGILLGLIGVALFTRTRFKRRLEEEGEVVPEERLIPMMVGGALLPAGMFWFGWTSNPNILWVPQVISGAFIGAGVILIFIQGLTYIIDVYTVHANSALASNTFFRSWLAAGFPMFAMGMFHNLGVDWAMSLLGFLTAALFPVPILFYIYGAKIRSWSKYSS